MKFTSSGSDSEKTMMSKSEAMRKFNKHKKELNCNLIEFSMNSELEDDTQKKISNFLSTLYSDGKNCMQD